MNTFPEQCEECPTISWLGEHWGCPMCGAKFVKEKGPCAGQEIEELIVLLKRAMWHWKSDQSGSRYKCTFCGARKDRFDTHLGQLKDEPHKDHCRGIEAVESATRLISLAPKKQVADAYRVLELA